MFAVELKAMSEKKLQTKTEKKPTTDRKEERKEKESFRGTMKTTGEGGE